MSKKILKIVFLIFICLTNLNAGLFESFQSGLMAFLNTKNSHSSTHVNATSATVINHNSQQTTVLINGQTLPDKLEACRISLANNAQTFFGYVKSNKYKFGAAGLGTLYLYNNYKLFWLERKLRDKNCWSIWKNNKNLNQLLEYTQDGLSKELMFEIQKKYTNPNAPMDFIRPLIQFAKTIDMEKKYLENYQKTCSFIKKIKISGLFIVNDNLLKSIESRTARLNYLNNIFINWLTTCKLEQNQTIVVRRTNS
ncbi:hypothetical protein M1446_04960 [Candidatus Dependentiae bacterium]|nr:hypothetical protein [Candidatus Dependentiae bacterium]